MKSRGISSAARAAGAAAALSLAAAAGAAQEPGTGSGTAPVVGGERAREPIVLDGRLQEAAWGDAEAATGFVQFSPNPGAPASQETEAYVLYDDVNLYVGARLHDTAPDSIVARLARRDTEVRSDWFFASFDSYNDRRTAFVFAVNPRGVQRDFLLFDDTRQDDDWDAVWDVAAQVDSLGWTVEMRIPLSQLRFGRSQDREMTWGVNFRREIARLAEVDTWARLSPNQDRQVSLFGTLTGLRGIRPPRRLELRPYAVSRLRRAPGDDADPLHRAYAPSVSLGGDAQYGVTSDLTLNVTLNPDFGQIEADPSEVNLTAFETFFPEKRPFFVEGSEVFDVKGPEIFYSRRIGRQPRGGVPASAAFDRRPEQSTIVGAAKLTGRTPGGWTVGALTALTAEERGLYVDTLGARRDVAIEPLTSYSVVRARRPFRAGQSLVGGILTATYRPGPDEALRFLPLGSYVGGMDLRHRFGGGGYELAAGAYGSHVRGDPRAITALQLSSARYFQRPGADHLSFDPERTRLSGWNAEARVRDLAGRWQWVVEGIARSPGFEINDLGFLGRVDEVSGTSQLIYNQARPAGALRRYRVRAGQEGRWTFGGERTATSVNLDFDGQLRGNLWTVFAAVQHNLGASSPTALRGGPLLAFDPSSSVFARVRSDVRKPFWAELGTGYARVHGTSGHELTVSPALFYRPATNVELSAYPRLVVTRVPDQFVARRSVRGTDEFVTAELLQRTASMTVGLAYALTRELSLQVYAEPFLSAGSYRRYARVDRPAARAFGERFDELGDRAVLDTTRNSYDVDLDGNGNVDFTFSRPDFNDRRLNSNVVLRWEYRSGSTLFVVWSHAQTDRVQTGSFNAGRDLGGLLAAPGDDTLLIKVSYWLGM